MFIANCFRTNLEKIMSTSVLCLPPTTVDNNGHQDVARLQKENQVSFCLQTRL